VFVGNSTALNFILFDGDTGNGRMFVQVMNIYYYENLSHSPNRRRHLNIKILSALQFTVRTLTHTPIFNICLLLSSGVSPYLVGIPNVRWYGIEGDYSKCRLSFIE